MKICIQNLGKYNEGELHFEWVDLPCEKEELDAAMKKIGIGEVEVDDDGYERHYEEWMIADWENIWFEDVGEYSDPYELNEKAEEIEDLDEEEQLVMKYMIEEGWDYDEALKKVQGQDYTIYSGMDLTDVAYEWLEEDAISPETIKSYFDAESFARDLEHDGYAEVGDNVINIH